FWRNAPYTEADLQAQIDNAVATSGARGQQALADVNAYLDGPNPHLLAPPNTRLQHSHPTPSPSDPDAKILG
ncbi:hypothetical protein, partial [Streptomyces acidiscabies]|uniref:hypothetical protein n=1 Tax=Streptomyces acidiscabies TaxID=42234 RepID=UPI000A5AC551